MLDIKAVDDFKSMIKDHKVIEAFTTPIKSFGYDGWRHTLVDILYKGGISDLRTIRLPGAGERESRDVLLATINDNPRLEAYVLAFLLNIFRNATVCSWCWRKQGEYASHLSCPKQTKGELKEALKLIEADRAWYASQPSTTIAPEVPWLGATPVATSVAVLVGASAVGAGEASCMSTKSLAFSDDSASIQ